MTPYISIVITLGCVEESIYEAIESFKYVGRTSIELGLSLTAWNNKTLSEGISPASLYLYSHLTWIDYLQPDASWTSTGCQHKGQGDLLWLDCRRHLQASYIQSMSDQCTVNLTVYNNFEANSKLMMGSNGSFVLQAQQQTTGINLLNYVTYQFPLVTLSGAGFSISP